MRAICLDGNPCDTWFGADGSLICRHGLVAEGSDNTSVDAKCPLELLEASEKKKWKQFFEDLPMIMEKLGVYTKR